MFMRVVRFTGVSAEKMQALQERIDSSDGVVVTNSFRSFFARVGASWAVSQPEYRAGRSDSPVTFGGERTSISDVVAICRRAPESAEI